MAAGFKAFTPIQYNTIQYNTIQNVLITVKQRKTGEAGTKWTTVRLIHGQAHSDQAYTSQPISLPTYLPTYLPTNHPCQIPSNHHTYQPTNQPANLPTNVPGNLPTSQPINQPTYQPAYTMTQHDLVISQTRIPSTLTCNCESVIVQYHLMETR